MRRLIWIRWVERGTYLAYRDERMTECREKDLSCHNEDVFCFKESLPLFPRLWVPVDFRTHSLGMSDCVCFNHISLLKHQMNQRDNKDANLLLLINLKTRGNNLHLISQIHPLLNQYILDQQTCNQSLPSPSPQHSNSVLPPRPFI